MKVQILTKEGEFEIDLSEDQMSDLEDKKPFLIQDKLYVATAMFQSEHSFDIYTIPIKNTVPIVLIE